MKIQVIGSGCPTCKNLFELTKKAVAELGIEAEVEYSTDVSKIIEMGVMQSPVLAIDGKPAMLGSGSLEKIKAVLKNSQEGCCGGQSDKPCSCGGNCC